MQKQVILALFYMQWPMLGCNVGATGAQRVDLVLYSGNPARLLLVIFDLVIPVQVIFYCHAVVIYVKRIFWTSLISSISPPFSSQNLPSHFSSSNGNESP